MFDWNGTTAEEKVIIYTYFDDNPKAQTFKALPAGSVLDVIDIGDNATVRLRLRDEPEPKGKGITMSAARGKELIDAYMDRHAEFKKRFLEKGYSEEEADDMATTTVRREIQRSPPINLG